MALDIHFISGLPRSGSTLLAAILRQNPQFHASIQSPVSDIFSALQRSMSGFNESNLFISDDQRRSILLSMVESFYSSTASRRVIFDNNRAWCKDIVAISELFPRARIICCVRNIAWILDSIERLVQSNSFEPSRLFNFETAGHVYSRAETLMNKGFVGASLSYLRQAWFGERADRIIAVRYDSLSQRPRHVISRLYGLLGIDSFEHNFENVAYEEREFDARLGLQGLHRVRTRVEARNRTTILPPELFAQHDQSFWNTIGQNPRGVTIL